MRRARWQGDGDRGRRCDGDRRRPAARPGPSRRRTTSGRSTSRLPVVAGDGTGAAVPARLVRRGPARRAVLRAGCAAPSGRRPLADPAERRRRARRRCRRSCSRRAATLVRAGRSARLQRVHDHRGGVGRPSRHRRASRSTRLRPTVGAWRPFGQGWRVLPQDADTDGMVADSVPSTAVTDDVRPQARLQAKVLTVSDGVVHGTREDLSGRALVDHLTDNGFDVVDHRVTADGADLVAARPRRDVRRVRRARRVDGWHRLRPARSDARGNGAVIEREAPGLAEAMRLCNPLGRLSRGVAGIRGNAHHREHARQHQGLRRAARRRHRRAAARPATPRRHRHPRRRH